MRRVLLEIGEGLFFMCHSGGQSLSVSGRDHLRMTSLFGFSRFPVFSRVSGLDSRSPIPFSSRILESLGPFFTRQKSHEHCPWLLFSKLNKHLKVTSSFHPSAASPPWLSPFSPPQEGLSPLFPLPSLPLSFLLPHLPVPGDSRRPFSSSR